MKGCGVFGGQRGPYWNSVHAKVYTHGEGRSVSWQAARGHRKLSKNIIADHFLNACKKGTRTSCG